MTTPEATLSLAKPLARCVELPEARRSAGLEIRRSAPGYVMVQIWSNGSITESGKGKGRHMLSMLELKAEEAEQVIETLQTIIPTLSRGSGW